MAEANPDAKAPAAPAGPAPKPRKSKSWMLIAAMMALEGVGVFFAARMLSSHPEPAMAEEAAADTHGEHGEKEKAAGGPETNGTAELALSDAKTFNKETGKLVLLHMRVSALIAAPDQEKGKTLVAAKQARIDDRINTVIRSCEPKHLNEPGLETIKRRLKFECDRIFEDETLIREILIPYLVQSGSGL